MRNILSFQQLTSVRQTRRHSARGARLISERVWDMDTLGLRSHRSPVAWWSWPNGPSHRLRLAGELQPSCFAGERNYISASFRLQVLRQAIGACSFRMGKLFHMQACDWSELRGRGKAHPQCIGLQVNFDSFKGAGIKSEPKSERGDINTHARGIERRSGDRIPTTRDVVAECLPTELRICEPVFGCEKASHVGDNFFFKLGDEILDRLRQAVVSDRQARVAPHFAAHRICDQSFCTVIWKFADGQCA